MLYGKRRAALYLTNYISRVEMKKLMAKIPKYLKDNEMEDCTLEVYIKPGLRKYQDSMNKNAVKALKAINPDYNEDEKVVEVKELNVLIAEANAGFTDVVFFGHNSKFESDAMRYNSMSTARKEQNDRVDRKNEILHYTDQLIQHVDYHDTVDKFLYWVLPQFKREIEFVHVDTAYTNYTLYSVTKEFYKPVEHFKDVSPKVEAWSKALGYTRRQTIAFLMWANAKRMSEDEIYAFANGVLKGFHMGATADTQIVKCPECGLPTVAAPASIGSMDNHGKFYAERPDSKQMTCELCGADLSVCFDIDYSVPPERYTFRKQDEADDIFDSIADTNSDIRDEDINASEICRKARIRARVARTPWLVRKNDVPKHVATHHANSSVKDDYRAEDVTLSKRTKVKTSDSLYLMSHPELWTKEQKARMKSLSKPLPVKNRKDSSETACGGSASVEEIRKRNASKKPAATTPERIAIMKSEVPADFPVTVIK